MTVKEQRIRIGRAPRLLEAVVAEPAGPARGGAVVCHPHPQFGGDMDNGVVVAVARALVASGLVVLRFNFGGVGRSQGTYSGGTEEVADVGHALVALAERAPAAAVPLLVGYSFGAWVALRAACTAEVAQVVAIGPPLAMLDWGFVADLDVPAVFLVGERDRFCPPDRLAIVRAASRRPIEAVTIPGADHFFLGAEDRMAAGVVEAWRMRTTAAEA